jgi:hypothetical protein
MRTQSKLRLLSKNITDYKKCADIQLLGEDVIYIYHDFTMFYVSFTSFWRLRIKS